MELNQRTGAAEIAATLRRQILSRELQPHERLPAERALAQMYGVARGTVRDAFNRLADEGLVEIRAGSGTYVGAQPGQGIPEFVVEHARPLELIDARFALEPHICRLVVLHARPKDFERLEQLLVKMENSVTDPVGFSIADTEFHLSLVEFTGNSLLLNIVQQLSEVRNHEQWSRMRRVTLNVEAIENYNQQHRGIFNALCAREPEYAATLMKQHLETARLSLTRAAST